jgi:hypothetical protein
MLIARMLSSSLECLSDGIVNFGHCRTHSAIIQSKVSNSELSDDAQEQSLSE